MSHIQYITLLRGINVGGNNSIKMVDLKKCLTNMGLQNVRTYIQSGNVVFSAPKQDSTKLTKKIEDVLTRQFQYKSRVLLLTEADFKKTVEQAPKTFGKDPDTYRYDVIFVIDPLTTKEARNAITLKEGVDTVDTGKHALYFSRLISKASQSRLAKIVSLALYKNTTVRNWNTTTKLLKMLDE